MMIRRLSVVAAAFGAVLVSQAAMADDSVVVMRVPVHYGDLNLASPDGQSVLQTRIAAAAAKACGGNPAFHPQYANAARFVKADFEKCRRTALTAAVSELDARGVRYAAR